MSYPLPEVSGLGPVLGPPLDDCIAVRASTALVTAFITSNVDVYPLDVLVTATVLLGPTAVSAKHNYYYFITSSFIFLRLYGGKGLNYIHEQLHLYQVLTK